MDLFNFSFFLQSFRKKKIKKVLTNFFNMASSLEDQMKGGTTLSMMTLAIMTLRLRI